MKTTNIILTLGFFICIIFYSCEFEQSSIINDSQLAIEFSNGTIITENDINFYDSSIHTYFLKAEIQIDDSTSDFILQVNKDTIFEGVIYSCYLSAPPPTPYFISDCFFSGRDIVQVGYYGISKNLLNDIRIINSLKEDNLLRHGLSCRIDSIKVTLSEEHADVICTITIINHDNIAYFIPDAKKMGDDYFTDYNGGLFFKNLESVPSPFYTGWNGHRHRDDIQLTDLSLLDSNSEVTYTYSSSNYYAITEGIYSVRLRFMGIIYTAEEFELDQDSGRIWVGEIYAIKDSVIVE